jgi:hypothetical protein
MIRAAIARCDFKNNHCVVVLSCVHVHYHCDAELEGVYLGTGTSDSTLCTAKDVVVYSLFSLREEKLNYSSEGGGR